jgi:FMN phosphatase YigB (HAD superfamily)
MTGIDDRGITDGGISQVVFDIGQVLVKLRPAPLFALLAEHGYQPDDLERVARRIGIVEHETGRLDGAGLLANVAALAPCPPDPARLRAAWLDMFEPDRRMIDLATRLRATHGVFLLSNVGDLHWAHLRGVWRVHELAHDALPSFEVGVMKPDEAIYREAERRFALDPARTVFIDDRAENVAAARVRGWQAIHHGDTEDTLQALRALGVDTEAP